MARPTVKRRPLAVGGFSTCSRSGEPRLGRIVGSYKDQLKIYHQRSRTPRAVMDRSGLIGKPARSLITHPRRVFAGRRHQKFFGVTPAIAGLIFNRNGAIQLIPIGTIGPQQLAVAVVDSAPDGAENFRKAFEVNQLEHMAAPGPGLEIQGFYFGQGIIQFYQLQVRRDRPAALKKKFAVRTAQIEEVDAALLQHLTDDAQRVGTAVTGNHKILIS